MAEHALVTMRKFSDLNVQEKDGVNNYKISRMRDEEVVRRGATWARRGFLFHGVTLGCVLSRTDLHQVRSPPRVHHDGRCRLCNDDGLRQPA